MTVDLINHPPHYADVIDGVECIDITRHLSFDRGNAVKYLWRHKDKGTPVADLQKAVWYIRDDLELYLRGVDINPDSGQSSVFEQNVNKVMLHHGEDPLGLIFAMLCTASFSGGRHCEQRLTRAIMLLEREIEKLEKESAK